MTYKVELIRSEEGYAVWCPELPGCCSQGETEDEAIDNIRVAIREYLSVQPLDETPKETRFVEVEPESADEFRQPFRVTARPMGLPTGMSYEKMSLLLEQIERREDEVR